MPCIEENVKKVYGEIESAALSCGRDPGEITLVAASKQNCADRVADAKAAGIRVFGENRVQELLEKNSSGAYDGAQVHFIGHLQKNKVKNVVGLCSLIQSVDSKELMLLISKRAEDLGIVQDILIEVNIGREETKSGVYPEQLEDILEYAGSLGGICVKGLMAIPPKRENNVKNEDYFAQMYNLYVYTKAKKYYNTDICILSMGMSADYKEAIAAGSNMVRVGSAIFGPRA